MRPEQMRKIAAASSAGFAMPITAQVDGEEPDLMDSRRSPFDADWSRRMLDDLHEDQRVSDMIQDVGEENIVPTDEQREKIEDLKAMFPEAMDFSTPDVNWRDLEDPDSGYDEDEDALPFGGPSVNLDQTSEYPDGVYNPWKDGESFASNSARLIRLAAHLDSLGLHDAADELDAAAMSEIEDLLESLPDVVAGPKGKPIKASVRTAQAAMAEVGLDEDDVDLEQQDDQAQIVSFDPERGNMIVRAPDGLFKLYEITGVGPGGKPRFELGGILDSPDDRVSDYTSRLMGGNPSLEGYGEQRLPRYLDQLMGGNPDIQQAYGGPM